jgi:beta-glucanase (GH16 family)
MKRQGFALLLAGLACAGWARCGDTQSAAAITSTPPAADAGWTLVWSDEFEGDAGTPPSPAQWKHDVGGGGWGNQQLEFDTDLAQNASLDGHGHLAITALKQNFGGNAYSSARINTAGLFDQAYGRFEASIQLPKGAGLWPAFWLLGANVNTVPWPGCGEIDIMEYKGQQPALIHGSAHGPNYSGGRAITASHGLPGNAGDFSTGFHVFAVEWTPDRVDYRVDDTVYETITPQNLPAGSTWVFDHPFFVLLNLAVGGNYVGNPDVTTPFPAVMLVDYVRVYEQAK